MTHPDSPPADPRHDKEDGRAQELIERGSDLAGALAGGGFSLLGGPLGALGGPALGVAIKHAATVVAGHLFGRQAERAGATALLIANRHKRGERPVRDDGFFDTRDQLRSPGEELLEGVLLKAADAYEERKIPLLAALYDGIAHTTDVSPADANHLLRLAERLSYRQLVLLAVLADDRHFRTLARASSTKKEGRTTISPTLAADLEELGDLGLVGVRVEGKGPFRVGATYGSTGPISEKELGSLKLLETGRILHRLMDLELIPGDEQDEVVGDFARPRDD